jgi:hypothetical protein
LFKTQNTGFVLMLALLDTPENGPMVKLMEKVMWGSQYVVHDAYFIYKERSFWLAVTSTLEIGKMAADTAVGHISIGM